MLRLLIRLQSVSGNGTTSQDGDTGASLVLAMVHTPTSTSTSSAGGRCLAFGRVEATNGTDRATTKKGATNL
jgi:hypothetical protein